MIFLPHDQLSQREAAALVRRRITPNAYDIVSIAVMLGLLVLLARGAEQIRAPVGQLSAAPVALELVNLPDYALRTTLRMFAAIIVSLVFTFVVATLAAKSRRAGMVIIPALDILQSVPVLGFLTFTVTFFTGLFPGTEFGAECAAIFAVFTAQAWNMTFSLYQSLCTVPRDLDEVSRAFGLSAWQRFWRLEAPFAAPGLIWNTMMSMSGGWFFVVASEAITVGNTTIELPGIGSWLARAIDQKAFGAVISAVTAMAIIIFCYDQLLFRPVMVWADKFRAEQVASQDRPQSFVYQALRRTRVLKLLLVPLARGWQRLMLVRLGRPKRGPPGGGAPSRALDASWLGLVLALAAWGAVKAVLYTQATLGWADVSTAFMAGLMTLLRVIVLVALASLVWVPVGVWVGLRPGMTRRVQPLAQFLAAFPANILFPFIVIAIIATGAGPSIWLSPLMILGAQWYILFNVIAGASAFPSDLKEAAAMLRIRSWSWWHRVILPGIFPYYVTGALTASGGAWNASIVAEVASWGDVRLTAFGLGSYISEATRTGDYPRVVLGIMVMALLVTILNRILWRPLYVFAERRLRLD